MEKFSSTKILCQSPVCKQNVSTVPLQLGNTHSRLLLHLPRPYLFIEGLGAPPILFVELLDSLQCHGS